MLYYLYDVYIRNQVIHFITTKTLRNNINVRIINKYLLVLFLLIVYISSINFDTSYRLDKCFIILSYYILILFTILDNFRLVSFSFYNYFVIYPIIY